MRKTPALIIGCLFLSLLIAVTTSVGFAKNNGSSGKPSVVPPRVSNVDIVRKKTLPSPDALPEAKNPPSHANNGGNSGGGNDDDGDSTNRGLGTSLEGEAYAIVIGIADYPGTDYDLDYTDDDAKQVKKTLTEEYGYATSNITDLIVKDGSENESKITTTTVKTAIDDIRSNVSSSSEVVFFFSGHGGNSEKDVDNDGETTDESIIVQGKDGEKLVPIWDGDLASWFSGIETDRIYFGFDSCLAGGMDDVVAKGNIFTAAANETNSAYEFDSMNNGQFTHYFFEEGMYKNQADGGVGSTTQVTVEEAYNYTDDSYHPRYKKDGPVMDDRFPSDSDNDNDLLLNYKK